jgi:hypothetical protein
MAKTIDLSPLDDLIKLGKSVEFLARLAVAAFNQKIGKGGELEKQFFAGQTQWKPLSPKYRERKKRQRRSTRIWERTGESFRAFVECPELKGPGRVGKLAIEVNPSTKVVRLSPVGINDNKMIFANARRPWFVWTPRDEGVARDAVEDALLEALIDEGFEVV